MKLAVCERKGKGEKGKGKGRRMKGMKGDIVTVAYEKCSRKAVPMEPTITHVRSDLSWEEVLHSTKHEVVGGM
jgi:hypothetical protein